MDVFEKSRMPERPKRVRLVALLLGLCLAGGAAAEDVSPEILTALSGQWLAAPVSGMPGCRIRLSMDLSIGGHAVEGAEDNCSRVLPDLANSAAWALGENGALLLIDPERKVLARFEEREGGPYLSAEKGGIYLLKDPPGGVDAVPTATSLAGEWRLERPGGDVICRIKLSDIAADADTFPASPTGDCTKAVTSLELFRYQLDGFSLSLMGKDGQSLLMEQTAPGRFEKAREEGGKPLVMRRQP